MSPKTHSDARETTPSRSADGLGIHFADGNKGGVGKSLFCRTLYQWFLDHQHAVIGIEADVNAPDFKGLYPDVGVAQFSEDDALGARANLILNTTAERACHCVVNLPATVHESFRRWVENYDIIALAQENQIRLVKWFVITGEFDSLKSLEVSLDAFGDAIPHVVVCNQKYSEWEFFQSSEAIQAAIHRYAAVVIQLPKLPLRVASTMLQARLSFENAQTYTGKHFGLAEQSAVRKYLRTAYAQFQDTGWLPQ